MLCSYVKCSQQKVSVINVNMFHDLNLWFVSLMVCFFIALVLVYDYHPGSQTLLAKYFTPTSDSNNYQDPFQGEARPFR